MLECAPTLLVCSKQQFTGTDACVLVRTSSSGEVHITAKLLPTDPAIAGTTNC